MIVVHLLTRGLEDKFVSVHTKEAANAIWEISGKDMSFDAYDRIIANILTLDNMYGTLLTKRAQESE